MIIQEKKVVKINNRIELQNYKPFLKKLDQGNRRFLKFKAREIYFNTFITLKESRLKPNL